MNTRHYLSKVYDEWEPFSVYVAITPTLLQQIEKLRSIVVDNNILSASVYDYSPLPLSSEIDLDDREELEDISYDGSMEISPLLARELIGLPYEWRTKGYVLHVREDYFYWTFFSGELERETAPIRL